jgi:hypothetical protein
MAASVLIRSMLSIAVLAAAVAPAAAQAERVTLGAQLSMLGVTDDEDSIGVGVGARGSYEFSRWLAADAEFSFFPRDRAQFDFDATPIGGGFTTYTRRRIAMFAGAKAGVRSGRLGVFAKARPGFTRLFDRGVGCSGEICALILLARPVYCTEFAMDVGGVLELYPSGGSLLRFDLGTTLVRHRSLVPPCHDCTTRNLSSSVGAGWRF